MAQPRKATWSDLTIRLASALVMAGLALFTNWLGGPFFALFWLVAALAVLGEWLFLVTPALKDWLAVGIGSLTLAVATWLAYGHQGGWAVLVVAIGALAIGVFAAMRGHPHPWFAAAAVPYAAAVVLPVTILRQNEPHGMIAIFVLFAIVWGSDVMAYFTGRTFGGPKLCPRISPKKTWSGFIGGVIFGALGAGLVAGSIALIALGTVLSAVSQGGDLLESALKRRFDAKDASHLIPGHGGVMDRLDGFLAAALTALVIGLIHAGSNPASGFLVW